MKYNGNAIRELKKRVGLAKSGAGFTLIEATVATTVFAVAMTSMVGVYVSVQRLNSQSSALQALQQNARFISEDLTKTINNGQIDYARYGSVPQPFATDLYLRDKDQVQIRIYQSGNDLMVDKAGVGTAQLTGSEVRVLSFQVYIWPATNPFPGGTEHPTVTLYLDMENSLNLRDKTRLKFQITMATREYPE